MNPTQGYLTNIGYSTSPNPSPSGYTPVANVLSIKPPDIEAKDIDTTVLDSPDQFETFVPGWANGGEAQFKIQFDKTQNGTIYGMFRTPATWRIMFPDGTTSSTGSNLVMPGYIKKFANEIERENTVQADITVKITGKPVFNPGT